LDVGNHKRVGGVAGEGGRTLIITVSYEDRPAPSYRKEKTPKKKGRITCRKSLLQENQI